MEVAFFSFAWFNSFYTATIEQQESDLKKQEKDTLLWKLFFIGKVCYQGYEVQYLICIFIFNCHLKKSGLKSIAL